MDDRSKKFQRIKQGKNNNVRVIQEKQGKLKSQKAITLVSLVITIVILIILATVSINVLLGDGGLINQAKTAKFETEKATAREQIEVVLVQAQMDKALNNEYNENEYLDKFVEDRLKGVWLEQDEIAYDGFIFALDRSVPKLGNYTGQDEGPRIKEIKVTGKTTNSVSIEVDARNAEGGKYTYSYKKDSEGEDAWVEVKKDVEENTCTFENLEENEIYNLKVRIETTEGEIEQTINEMTGELPKGTITFDEVEWVGDGTAKVRINTTETGYTMQYIIVKQGESTEGLEQKNWSEIASGSEITGLYYADTVYARLYDGKNESDYASVTVEDKIKPTVTVEKGIITSNSIRVSVQAQDSESGMKDNLTYTYYIKQTSEGEGSYQVPVGATNITSNTYIFTELIQGTSYDIKVEVNGDKANNVGTGILENQTTGTVPGGETGVEEGAITFGNTTWGSNNKASVTVDTNTSYTIEYQVGNITEGSWTEIEKGGTIGNLNYNDTVYARLTDGTNHGDYASVTIEDKIAPVVNVTGKGTTSNSVSVSVTATDGQSGMKDSLTYTYSIKESTQPDTSYNTPGNASNISVSSYTFTGLTQGKNYTVRVQVNGDKANNVGTGTLENQITGTVPGGETGVEEGAISFGNTTWGSNNKASVTVDTNTSYTIEYQVGNITEGSWTEIEKGGTIGNLNYNDTVYARLTDGTNHGDYASVTIEDKIAPEVTVTGKGTTSNSVTVSATATDGQSGMKDSLTYTYSIKESTQPDTSYNTPGNATNISASSYTFTGLTQGKNYTVRVQVNGDKAENVGIGTLENQTTGTVPGGETGVEEGAISFGNTTWGSNNKASVTVDTNTSYTIEYQVGNIEEGSWTEIEKGGTIGNLNYNDTVYARLTDGTNHGDYASVTIEDKIPPSKVIINSNGANSETWTKNDIRLDLSSTDGETGIAKYQLSGDYGKTWYDCSNPYVVSTDYRCFTIFRAIDNAGNIGQISEGFELMIDKTSPTATLTLGTVTTNSIAVSVSASDGQGSGLATTGTYKYYINNELKSTSTTNSYTFIGLTDETTYTIMVEIFDEAGNKETKTLSVTTTTIGGAEGGLQTGNITASAPTWNNGLASITLSTSTGYTIQYQVNNTTEGNWQTGTNVTGLHHGDAVFARLTDGNNYGDEASVNILDGIPPTVNFSTTKTYNSISITVTATDNESGLADNNIYTYSITGGSVEGESTVTKNTNTHTFSGLNAETSYTIKVEVKDKANNVGNKQETVTTEPKPIPSTVDDAKTEGTKYTDTTPIKDDLDNTVYIPGGFHIAGDSATKVEGGIVIEDDSGNQFVWIPVGTYKTSSGSKTNALSRRTFTSSGATILSGDSAIGSSYYGEGNSSSVAYSQIGAFKTSATNYGGFYIGRYEQGSGNVCKAGVDVYTNVTRDKANTQAKAMYSGKSEIKATSELISSYAWDTALNFICQTNTEGYKLATTTSSSYGNIGTNNKKQTGEYEADNYSNIHDLLGNCIEWTTEYCSNSSEPCISRGGYSSSGGYHYAASRGNYSTSYSKGVFGFRLQLYVK